MTHWDRIKGLIDKYDKVFTESSLDTVSQEYINKYVFFQESDMFLKYITINRWERMRKTFIKYFDVDIERMRDMRPLFILSFLYQSLEPSVGSSMDQRIWKYAADCGKSVDGIEKTEEQVAIMLSLSNRLQYRQLVRMSRKVRGLRGKFKNILNAYQEQDILKLLKLSKNSLGLDKVALLQDRNEIMVARMMTNQKTNPSFYCFGAGHLAGMNGVLTLLKKKGAIVSAL